MAAQNDSLDVMAEAAADLVEIAAKELNEDELATLIRDIDFVGRFACQKKAEMRARAEGRAHDARQHAENARRNLEFLSTKVRDELVGILGAV